ncbi:MAG: hypothetical protein V1837_01200 [Candidatus Woesearchaeota archaeon]
MKKHFSVLDLLWPLLKAIFSTAAYFLVVLILYLINLIFHSSAFSTIISGLFTLVYIVFFLAVVSSYANHFRMISGLAILVPFLLSLSTTLIIYFIAYIFDRINSFLSIGFISVITGFVIYNLLYIFIAITAISYLVALLGPRRHSRT